MFSHLIVPVYSWAVSTQAVRVAADLAAATGATLDLVAVTAYPEDRVATANMLTSIVVAHGPLPVEPTQHVDIAASVSEAVAARFAAADDALIVMNSHGRGRVASVLGSTATELLAATGAPIVVVGPNAGDQPTRVDGTYIIPLDGSERGDGILPVVADWARGFGGDPVLVEVIDPDADVPDDVTPEAVVATRAKWLGDELGRTAIEYDTLRDERPGRAILDFAERRDASLVFMATHGRTCVARLRAGSVAADVVRHATCPVVMFRPRDLAAPDTDAETPRPA